MTKPEPGMPILVPLGDDRKHELLFTLGVLRELKAEHNIDLMKSGAAVALAIGDPGSLAIVLHAGLKTLDPEMTLAWVERNVDVLKLRDLVVPLVYAATGNWLDLDVVAAQQQRPNGSPEIPARQTGPASGLSGDSISSSAKPNSGA